MKQSLVFCIELTREFDVEALGGQPDRCERIFNFMRKASCHFTPSKRLLRVNHGRHVVKNNHPAFTVIKVNPDAS